MVSCGLAGDRLALDHPSDHLGQGRAASTNPTSTTAMVIIIATLIRTSSSFTMEKGLFQRLPLSALPPSAY